MNDTPNLTPEQLARLADLVRGAIFATTSWLVAEVKADGGTSDRAREYAHLIESDRRLTVVLDRLALATV